MGFFSDLLKISLSLFESGKKLAEQQLNLTVDGCGELDAGNTRYLCVTFTVVNKSTLPIAITDMMLCDSGAKISALQDNADIFPINISPLFAEKIKIKIDISELRISFGTPMPITLKTSRDDYETTIVLKP